VAASAYFEDRGQVGFVHPERLPDVGDVFHGGDIGYHLRAGGHYLSREDWNLFIQFVKSKI
jgi:hypothetical protein